jgi:SAM-dependent methyltransferase
MPKASSSLLALRSSGLYASYRESVRGEAWSKHEPLIDIRPATLFERRHLRWATSIPLDELQLRMFELPPPYESSVSLYGSPSDMEDAAALLHKYGWNVTRLIDSSSSEESVEEGDEGDKYVQGLQSRPVWRPSAFLEELLTTPQVQEWARASPSRDSSISADGMRHALDIGCGAGRDMVLMARLLGPSWRVTGFDNDSGARERAEALAQLEGVREQIQTVDINLRKESLSLSAHLVHGCRFLDRRLLPRIRDEILEPNGLFVWSTFLQGSPRVRNGRSLEPGELRRLFVEDVPASEAFQVCGLQRVYTHHV